MTPVAIFMIALGPVFGSFAQLVSDRMASGETFLRGRSHCDDCGRTLRVQDLVPVLSWCMLRGRTFCCAARLSVRHPVVELAFLLVPLQALALGMQGPLMIATCVLGWTLLALSLIDIATMRLPDGLTLSLAAAGIGLAIANLTGTWLSHLAAAAGGLGAVIAVNGLYQRLRGQTGIGMGDAKLLMAAGAWTGPQGLFSTLAIGCVVGMVWGLLSRRFGSSTNRAHATMLPAGAFPLGPALALGLWITWVAGPVLPVLL